MAYVVIITMLTLLQYLYFAVRVGGARGRFNIPAPAMSGNEEFERYVREPGSRTVGFVLTLLANLALIGAALWGAIGQAF